MPATAIVLGSATAITAATVITAAPIGIALEPVGILTDSRHDQTSAADSLDDGDGVKDEHANPREHGKETQDAAEAERGHADNAGQEQDHDPQHQLRHHQ